MRLKNPGLSIRSVPRNTFAGSMGVCFKNAVDIAMLPRANVNFGNVLSPWCGSPQTWSQLRCEFDGEIVMGQALKGSFI